MNETNIIDKKVEESKNKNSIIDDKKLKLWIANRKSIENKLAPNINNFKSQTRGGFILILEDKILLILSRQSGLWGFPKGRTKDTDPNFLQVALRELHEETGIILNLSFILPGYIKFNTTFYYIAVLNSKPLLNPVDNFEIEAISWLKLSQLNILTLHSNVKTFISKYF